MDNSSDYKSIIDSKRKSNFEQDSEDIMRQISQIIASDDKSFDSPVIYMQNKAIFNDYNIDMNQITKENNISPFSTLYDKFPKKNNIKNDNTIDDENSIITNNKQLRLNHKLKYLCSLIQASNINIRKYDDLKQFNKFLEDKNNILNIFEPINLLFDIINELIFLIQKELRNNDILMKELKRLRYVRNDNERQIYKLKMNIIDKDKELNKLRILKKDEYIKYNENEIKELKNENKELYKKINTYKFHMKKFELNNLEIKTRLKSCNTEKIRSPSNLNKYSSIIIPNIKTINNLNNSLKNYKIKTDLTNYLNKNNISNKKRNYSASNFIDYKSLSNNINISNDNNNNNNINNIDTNSNNNFYNNSYNNRRSIITNLMLLLKEINEMLNIYNNSLSKIKINNNSYFKNDVKNEEFKVFEDNNNIKSISNEFLNKINSTIQNIKIFIKEENKEKLQNSKKLIYVNTSKWKIRKKNDLKKIFDNNKEDIANICLSADKKKNKNS